MREADGIGGVQSLNAELNTDYSAEEIGDVEHFYVAALLGTLGGPAGGVMLNAVGDGIWEMVIGPIRIAWGCTLKYGAKRGAKATLKSVKDNWQQLTGPDWAGTRFGSFYVFNEVAEELSYWLKVRVSYYSSQLRREAREMLRWLESAG